MKKWMIAWSYGDKPDEITFLKWYGRTMYFKTAEDAQNFINYSDVAFYHNRINPIQLTPIKMKCKGKKINMTNKVVLSIASKMFIIKRKDFGLNGCFH